MLCFALALPVQADELSETRERQQELEQQRDAAEEEQAELSGQLDSLVASMTETQEKLDAKQRKSRWPRMNWMRQGFRRAGSTTL